MVSYTTILWGLTDPVAGYIWREWENKSMAAHPVLYITVSLSPRVLLPVKIFFNFTKF